MRRDSAGTQHSLATRQRSSPRLTTRKDGGSGPACALSFSSHDLPSRASPPVASKQLRPGGGEEESGVHSNAHSTSATTKRKHNTKTRISISRRSGCREDAINHARRHVRVLFIFFPIVSLIGTESDIEGSGEGGTCGCRTDRNRHSSGRFGTFLLGCGAGRRLSLRGSTA